MLLSSLGDVARAEQLSGSLILVREFELDRAGERFRVA
jgi:hypothetical protein